jgi:hypothetical protein
MESVISSVNAGLSRPAPYSVQVLTCITGYAGDVILVDLCLFADFVPV